MVRGAYCPSRGEMPVHQLPRGNPGETIELSEDNLIASLETCRTEADSRPIRGLDVKQNLLPGSAQSRRIAAVSGQTDHLIRTQYEKAPSNVPRGTLWHFMHDSPARSEPSIRIKLSLSAMTRFQSPGFDRALSMDSLS